jgi:nucleotide-binding universal stress UspA family protein
MVKATGREMSGCIICGLDASPAVSEAVLVACWLSRRLACRLLLVNAARVPVVPGASGVPHAYDDLREDAIDEARVLLERTCEEHGLGGAAEQRVVLGDPVERLSALAEEEGAALLVVGTRGHGKLRSALFGSISRALAAKAPCPVVVVPAGTAVPRFIREPEAARRRDVGEATTRRPPIARRGGARGGSSRRTRSR